MGLGSNGPPDERPQISRCGKAGHGPVERRLTEIEAIRFQILDVPW
jgi:hypothetical protein